jgi:uncharacterized protein (DUF2267 family)
MGESRNHWRLRPDLIMQIKKLSSISPDKKGTTVTCKVCYLHRERTILVNNSNFNAILNSGFADLWQANLNKVPARLRRYNPRVLTTRFRVTTFAATKGSQKSAGGVD